jgi:hypothetical protein
MAVLAVAIVAFAGTVGNEAGFEDDDGNLVDDTGNTLIDWNTFAPVDWLPTPTTTPTREADKVSNGFTFKGIEDWQATTSDSGFSGGTKQDDECPDVITAKAPNKDDLKRIYLASTTKTVTRTGENGLPVQEDHTFLELAWVRIPQNTTSPSAHIAFEFNQADKGTCADQNADADGLAERTAGDMLVVYDFEGGATDDPTLTLSRWTTTGGDSCEVGSHAPPCWDPAIDLTELGFAEAKVNTTSTALDALTPPALNASSAASVNSTLGLNEFGEAGIDLTDAGVFEEGSCASFGTAFGVSRTSGSSSTAQMKDLVGPADFSLQNCGTVRIIKQTSPAGLDQDFGYTSTIAGSELSCTADATPVSFTLNDSGNVGDFPDREICTNVPAGSYTVTENADPAGFLFTDLSCTATGTGTSATPTSGNATRTATITMAGGGDVTCTYTNTQQRGAIEVIKTRKHAATPLNDKHQGVTFTVTQGTPPNVTTIASGQTDANGRVCFGNLPFGSYTVTETVPSGYSVNTNPQSTTVDNNAQCSDNPYGGESLAFINTPLTDITVSVNSQVDGGTGSTIDCDAADDPPFDATVPATAPDNGDGSFTLSNKPPGTYVCTVVVDP